RCTRGPAGGAFARSTGAEPGPLTSSVSARRTEAAKTRSTSPADPVACYVVRLLWSASDALWTRPVAGRRFPEPAGRAEPARPLGPPDEFRILGPQAHQPAAAAHHRRDLSFDLVCFDSIHEP